MVRSAPSADAPVSSMPRSRSPTYSFPFVTGHWWPSRRRRRTVLLWRERLPQFTEKRRRQYASSPLLDVPIRQVRGIHLTGVRDLPPRAVRRRSLQAGRMSALSRRLWRNSLWALSHNEVLVTNWSMRDSKLQDPVEQHPSAT